MVVYLGRGGRAPDTGWTVEKLSAIGRRFEASLVGEAVISGLVSLVLIIGVVWNLPDAQIRRSLMPVLRPVASAAGLEQGWRMYAPEPIHRLEFVEVHVTMADGADRVWTNQKGDLVIGPFAWYHWQKLKENLVREPQIRAGVAQWAVRELIEPSERAVRVHMVLRTEDLPAPGTDGPKTTAVDTLYDETLTRRP
jgi:hypothetical protein